MAKKKGISGKNKRILIGMIIGALVMGILGFVMFNWITPYKAWGMMHWVLLFLLIAIGVNSGFGIGGLER